METATVLMKKIDKQNAASIETLRRQVSYLGSQSGKLTRDIKTGREELDGIVNEIQAKKNVVAGLDKKVSAAEDEIREAQERSEQHLKAVRDGIEKAEKKAKEQEKQSVSKLQEFQALRGKVLTLCTDLRSLLGTSKDRLSKELDKLESSIPSAE